MLLALLVFAFAEYFRDPFGPGRGSWSRVEFYVEHQLKERTKC